MVLGGGFEPPTQGFSVPCSTPELSEHLNLGGLLISSLYLRDIQEVLIEYEWLSVQLIFLFFLFIHVKCFGNVR